MSDARGRTVVIGLGSALMGDDGLGLVALERLRPRLPAGVEAVDGGTWGLNLLPLIEDADTVLLLDAIDAGRAPGALIELRDDEVPRQLAVKFSPHDVDLQDVLALAALRGATPTCLVALGVQPESVELRTGLSPAVEAGVDRLVARAVALLKTWVGEAPSAAAARDA
jgi:hydrogenase maturation protease